VGEAIAPIAVPHVVKGEVREDASVEHPVGFVTPALDVALDRRARRMRWAR
jgi:hypothetical protein